MWLYVTAVRVVQLHTAGIDRLRVCDGSQPARLRAPRR
jgi:hypothetical protein